MSASVWSPVSSQVPVYPQLAGKGGSFSVGFSQPGITALLRDLQSKIREISISITDYPSLRDAIDSLDPDVGGVINIPVGRFPAGNWNTTNNYMAKANVRLQGAKLPNFNSTGTRLVGGSVIYGQFNVFADNFDVDKVGFDLGKDVVETYYLGLDTHTANYPGGSTWNAFTVAQPNTDAPLQPVKNLRIGDIICLMRDSSSFGHACLLENYNGGTIGSIRTFYGVHGCVIKALNTQFNSIASYGASADNFIIKSDSYANGGNVQGGSAVLGLAPPEVTAPWSTPLSSDMGFFINAATYDLGSVQIGNLDIRGSKVPVRLTGTTSARAIDNIQISNLIIDGFNVPNTLGIYADNAKFSRIRLGNVTATNLTDVIAYKQIGGFGDDALEISSLTMENVGLRCIQALTYGEIKIGRLRVKTANTLYSIDNTARVKVGYESLLSVTNKWDTSKALPTLNTAAWSSIGGFSGFGIIMHNYGITLQGLLSPTATPSPNVIALPLFLQPAESIRMSTISRNAANVDSMRLVSVGGGNANLVINDGANITGAENFLSLDNLSYRLD